MERIFFDGSSVKKPSDKTIKINDKRFWYLAVDEATGFKCSEFYRAKSNMVAPTVTWLNKERLAGRGVRYLRMDNAGENKTLERALDSPNNDMDVKIEYTSRKTPQQNSPVEQGFKTLYGRAKSAFYAASVPMAVRYLIFPEWIKIVTAYDNLCVTKLNGIERSRYEHMYGSQPAWTKNMKILGEAGTVALIEERGGKLNDKGVTCMFVGYATNHAGDCYKMWNENTNKYYLSRDVIFLQRMFYQKPVRHSEITIEPMTVIITREIYGESNEENDRTDLNNNEVRSTADADAIEIPSD